MAVGEVVLGDKEKAGEYKKYNEGHVPDIVQPGASAWGTDWIGETKVPSPLGAAPAKDQCEHVGHLVAFGNTEPRAHEIVHGWPEREAAGGAHEEALAARNEAEVARDKLLYAIANCTDMDMDQTTEGLANMAMAVTTGDDDE